MHTINILTTRAELAQAESYTDDERVIRFGRIDPSNPIHPIDGTCWIFIEWLLPQFSGLEFCQALRADSRWADSHISIILEEATADDRKRCMRAGADGYVTEPVTRQSLLDRVLTVTSSAAPAALQSHIIAGHFALYPAAMQARWKKQLVRLSPSEFRLLHFFIENPNRLHSRQDLIAGLGRTGEPVDERTVDAWISRLRRSLKDVGAAGLLRTVRSRGYLLEIE
ncbi:response regulator transcription factor [Alteriqipengyuania sp. WL0013]|uniref:response regulator transcription factor n=1 Tax=Alteriqipengyuania sp. WL0013 TaxID=3110773 RepID=UPI002B6AC26F|nr:response regulator transcription factor [Alteriqipengyuania sp. WL0013]MEB3414908.1 response regulator transcription factor [Alteriqipengyuania sp. WL0013]